MRRSVYSLLLLGAAIVASVVPIAEANASATSSTFASRSAPPAVIHRPIARGSLPDGGQQVTFDFGGLRVSYLKPPAGFDPRTADNAELALYGLPTRPAKAAQLATWSSAISHYQRVGDLPTQFTDPAGSFRLRYNTVAISSTNWSGYEDVNPASGYAGGTFQYQEPNVVTDSSSNCVTRRQRGNGSASAAT